MNIQRFTTRYITVEDRLCLSVASAQGEVAQVWLTWRVLKKLLPILLDWLTPKLTEKPEQATLAPAQEQAASKAAVPFVPVEHSASGEAPERAIHSEWLVMEIDVSRLESAVRLVFKGSQGEQVVLAFSEQPLKSWLGMLYCLINNEAGWAFAPWPSWVKVAGLSKRGITLH